MKSTKAVITATFGVLLIAGCDGDDKESEESAENTAVLCADGVDNDGDDAADCGMPQKAPGRKAIPSAPRLSYP